MRKLITLQILCFVQLFAFSQTSPGGVGIANLSGWYRLDNVVNNTSLTSFAPDASSLSVAPTLTSPVGPTVTTTPSFNCSNYNKTMDFTSNSIGATTKILGYNNLGTINLLNNSSSTGANGSFFISYFFDTAVNSLASIVLNYMETSSSGNGTIADAIGVKALNGPDKNYSRVMISTGPNSTNRARDIDVSMTNTYLFSYRGHGATATGLEAFEKAISLTNLVASSASGGRGLQIGGKLANPVTSGVQNPFNGYVNEVIFFNRALTDEEMQKVHSYLAIKFGSPLGGPSNPVNYLSSNGIAIWDAGAASNYNNDIIGIGQDINSDLFQHQSHTFNDNQRIYVGTLAVDNPSNTGIISNDESYVLLGNNKGSLNSTSTEYPAGSNLVSRLVREWRIQKNNFANNFSIDINMSSNPFQSGLNLSDLRLLVDADGDFTNATVLPATGFTFSYTNNILTIGNIPSAIFPVSTSAFFTIGSVSNVLPIHSISMKAKKAGTQKVQIDFATEPSNDFANFKIEKSIDSKTWSTLSTLIKTDAYFGVDNDFINNSYYRVVGYDNKGGAYYSSIQFVSSDIKNIITVHPNPAKSVVNIDVEAMIGKTNITITNLYGKTVKSQALNMGTNTINISDLAAGIYFVNTITSEGKTTEKLIVE